MPSTTQGSQGPDVVEVVVDTDTPQERQTPQSRFAEFAGLGGESSLGDTNAPHTSTASRSHSPLLDDIGERMLAVQRQILEAVRNIAIYMERIAIALERIAAIANRYNV